MRDVVAVKGMFDTVMSEGCQAGNLITKIVLTFPDPHEDQGFSITEGKLLSYITPGSKVCVETASSTFTPQMDEVLSLLQKIREVAWVMVIMAAHQELPEYFGGGFPADWVMLRASYNRKVRVFLCDELHATSGWTVKGLLRLEKEITAKHRFITLTRDGDVDVTMERLREVNAKGKGNWRLNLKNEGWQE